MIIYFIYTTTFLPKTLTLIDYIFKLYMKKSVIDAGAMIRCVLRTSDNALNVRT